MVLKIGRRHLDEIVKHARKCFPIEACGILVGEIIGEEKVVHEVYHVKNVFASPSEYLIDPQEMVRVFEYAENRGLRVLGFYHSHPFWEPFWSEVDNQKSKPWTGYIFLIISVKTGKIKAYVKTRCAVKEEDITVNGET